MLRASGSMADLCLEILLTRQSSDLLPLLGSVSCYITHGKTGGTICYRHWVLRPLISHTELGVLRVLDSSSCDITHETRGTICYGHWVLPRYEFLRVLGSSSRDITDETGGTICYGHRVLLLVISHTRQGVRFAAGIGICVLCYHTRDRGYDLLRALGSASCDLAHETGGTIC